MLLSEKLPGQGIFRNLENKDWRGYCSPQSSYSLAGALIPWLAAAALTACAAGLYLGLFVVPVVDVRHGELARIVFIHVPASWVAMLIYLSTAVSAGVGLTFNVRLAAMTAQALAPTGLLFAFLGLWTGCLWGKPIWGTWWLGDLRTYAELAMAFLYIGFIGLHAMMEDLRRANKAGALLLLAGTLSIPIILVVVPSWAAQYQGTPFGPMGATSMGAGELAGLLAISLGFLMYGGVVVLLRLRCVILERERQSDWVTRCGSEPP